MQSCSSCPSRNKIFTFYDDATNYESAIQKCRNKNPAQNIARFLNVADYRKLLACCRNYRSYWIGLKFDETNCRNGNQRFHWNSDGSCFNGRPLNVQPQPTNGNCFAVNIQTRTPDSGNINQARLSHCQQTHGYICERLINNSPSQRTTTATLSSRITTSGTANNNQITPKFYSKITNPKHKMTATNMRIQQATTLHTLFLEHHNTSVNSIRNTILSSTSGFENACFNNYVTPIVGGSIVLIILAFLIGFLCGRHSKRNNLNKSISHKTSWSSNRTVSAMNNLPGSYVSGQSFAATEQRNLQHCSRHLNEDNQYDVVFNKQINEELSADECASVYCQINLAEGPKDYENVDKLNDKTHKYKKKSNSMYLSPIGLQTNQNKAGKSATSATYM